MNESLRVVGGTPLVKSMLKIIDTMVANALISDRQGKHLREPLLSLKIDEPIPAPESPQDWQEVVEFIEQDEGEPFWCAPVAQPESLFEDALPELKIRQQDLARFVRMKALRYVPGKLERERFLKAYNASLRYGPSQTWEGLVKGLFELVKLQRWRRRQLREAAGAGLRALLLLADSVTRRPVRVPIRAQEQKVESLIALIQGRPVVGQVTTVLPSCYKRIYFQIGWRRPALVEVKEWTAGMRALRRGDRCLVWITGVHDVIGKEIVLATLDPPTQTELCLELPREYFRAPVLLPVPLRVGDTLSPVDGAKTMEVGNDGSVVGSESAGPPLLAETDRAGKPAVVATLEEELHRGTEFSDQQGMFGLAAIRARTGLEELTLSQDGVCRMRGSLEAVVAGVRCVTRVLSRYALTFQDSVTLAGLGLHYVSPERVQLPVLKTSSGEDETTETRAPSVTLAANGPFAHPYHWAEEEAEAGVVLIPEMPGREEERNFFVLAESEEAATSVVDAIQRRAEATRRRKLTGRGSTILQSRASIHEGVAVVEGGEPLPVLVSAERKGSALPK